MSTYLRYWGGMTRCAFVGSAKYYIWLTLVTLGLIVGIVAYSFQWNEGLIVTNMSDQVSWGAYIANFTFLVGVAAAAVLLVVPTYVYHRGDVKEVVLIGELLAVSAIVMCLAFVTVDLGRPDRFIHMIPGPGELNFPSSILAWDIIVLNGYLLLNLHVPGYLLYKRYKGEEPNPWLYLPFVFISIGWAISIHTVTAFLYSGFGGRPFWNSAILAPRFLVSAFASGPSLLIIVFLLVNRYGGMKIQASVLELLRKIISFMIPLNLFLLGCEVFKEFYTGTTHVVSAEYLFFGIDGHAMLTPYIWSGIGMEIIAFILFAVPPFKQQRKWLIPASVLCGVGIWIEKGMGLIIPGFIPSPAGDLVQYGPSVAEFFVCLGVWCLGALIFTVFAKIVVAIQNGELRAKS